MDMKHNKNDNNDNNNKGINQNQRQRSFVLLPKDFDPPPDDRCLSSNLGGFKGGCNFRDYIHDYFRYTNENYD